MIQCSQPLICEAGPGLLYPQVSFAWNARERRGMCLQSDILPRATCHIGPAKYLEVPFQTPTSPTQAPAFLRFQGKPYLRAS